jgi:hypothetical protein
MVAPLGNSEQNSIIVNSQGRKKQQPMSSRSGYKREQKKENVQERGIINSKW